MAITINPAEKIIQLDSFAASEKEIWTAVVDWAVTGDNLKYGEIITQIGGVVPIALYIYLKLGWLIRPIEADGITTISGNLLMPDGSSPIAPTVGNFNALVNMETPVKATLIEGSGGGSVVSGGEAINQEVSIMQSDEQIYVSSDTVPAVVLDDPDYQVSGEPNFYIANDEQINLVRVCE